MKKLIGIFFFLFATSAFAQVDSTRKDSVDFYEMNLEQLLKLKAHGVPTELEKLINSLIAVASKKPLSTRESPSIVSLVTKDEIKNSGARDLIDVLRLVPGIDFGIDVEGVAGIGVRGNWAHEGKVLLLIDGQEMNEIMYATTQFGNHYPIDNIERIEVIRGPGSAIYGGFAEYGVINIITKKGEDLNGISTSGIYGQTNSDFNNGWLRRNINLSMGKKIGDFEYSIHAMAGQGHRSDRNYHDFYGDTFNLVGNSSLNPTFFNVGMSYKNLSFRFLTDLYKTSTRDAYDEAKTEAYKESFNAYFGELKYLWKINDKVTLTPKLNFKMQRPWYTEEVEGVTEPYQKIAMRTLGNLTASWQIDRRTNFVFGSEFYADKARDLTDSSYFSNGEQTVNYYNYAFFTQGLIKTRIVNFVVGARYDKHNAYGDAFVPRVGVTKKYKFFHFKALYSNAFRAPSIENINDADSTGISPEKTQVIEIEAGYQITRKSFLTLNFYDIKTKNPIVYYYDPVNDVDAYHNFGKSGTRGIEAEYKIKQKWGYITLNYSFYTTAGKSRIADYRVTDDSTALLGFANHKVNLISSFKIAKGLTLNPSFTWYSPRYAFTSVDTLGESVQEKTPSCLLANVFVNWDTPVKGLTVGIGTYNILDTKLDFIQAYNGYHAPIPSPSREYFLRLKYDLNFKKKEKAE
jgi:outer membrane receptor for ferrienterochelin and colicin